MEAQSLRESLTDAIKFWEPRRIVYNLALAVVVLAYFAGNYPSSKAALTIDTALLVFILAVLANVAYCAAYVADIFAQASGFRDLWLKCRWIMFSIGLAFAGVITRYFAIFLFAFAGK